jgi:hypothetical protein
VENIVNHLPGVAVLLALPLLASAQSLAVKPGGWEMTHKTQIDGKAETIIEKNCVKKSDLESMDAFVKSEGCTHDIKSRTPTRWALSSTCLQGGAQSKSDIDLTVGSPESIAMKVATQITRGASTQTIRIDTTGRWRSASCAGFDE